MGFGHMYYTTYTSSHAENLHTPLYALFAETTSLMGFTPITTLERTTSHNTPNPFTSINNDHTPKPCHVNTPCALNGRVATHVRIWLITPMMNNNMNTPIWPTLPLIRTVCNQEPLMTSVFCHKDRNNMQCCAHVLELWAGFFSHGLTLPRWCCSLSNSVHIINFADVAAFYLVILSYWWCYSLF